jgi:hypothetical protein
VRHFHKHRKQGREEDRRTFSSQFEQKVAGLQGQKHGKEESLSEFPSNNTERDFVDWKLNSKRIDIFEFNVKLQRWREKNVERFSWRGSSKNEIHQFSFQSRLPSKKKRETFD